jgi:putative two-component system response regulator
MLSSDISADQSDRLEDVSQAAILIIDDDEWILRLLRTVLERAGYSRVQVTSDPTAVGEMVADVRPDLVLLDLHMPGVDGFELLELIGRLAGNGAKVPVLMLTADDCDQTKRRALAVGARDFLTKPFDQAELLLRVRNLLEVQHDQARLSEHNLALELEVAKRTSELELAQLEVLDRLALAAEFRDDATQQHARRIGHSCGLIARSIGLDDNDVVQIQRAAQLHDIGKIGIPDAILLKPGRLTAAEFAQVKQHTIIGAQILSGSHGPLLRLAEDIALTHHERWDGCGYPRRLEKTQIPLHGRIVAIADAFDALAHERPYKQAWPLPEALGQIADGSGREFDPALVNAFSRLDHATLVASPTGRLPQTRLRTMKSNEAELGARLAPADHDQSTGGRYGGQDQDDQQRRVATAGAAGAA